VLMPNFARVMESGASPPDPSWHDYAHTLLSTLAVQTFEQHWLLELHG
jgi:hypothetical protein